MSAVIHYGAVRRIFADAVADAGLLQDGGGAKKTLIVVAPLVARCMVVVEGIRSSLTSDHIRASLVIRYVTSLIKERVMADAGVGVDKVMRAVGTITIAFLRDLVELLASMTRKASRLGAIRMPTAKRSQHVSTSVKSSTSSVTDRDDGTRRKDDASGAAYDFDEDFLNIVIAANENHSTSQMSLASVFITLVQMAWGNVMGDDHHTVDNGLSWTEAKAAIVSVVLRTLYVHFSDKVDGAIVDILIYVVLPSILDTMYDASTGSLAAIQKDVSEEVVTGASVAFRCCCR